ncbi:MAG: tRNA (adenosine(37)-N6)-threonylcarbamoyltransferase complex dimerization subunit type 1 TsaB [Acidobacteriota bacterium]|nr:tRNA (adenosine(37)-N6)-threonylcarbamoyltransferase complex dimerization subunit type 1 TsaB [Acidobacteriota bacterium]
MSRDLTLVIETSIGGGSISLWEAGRLLESEVSGGKWAKSEELLKRIEDLCLNLGVTVRDVERIVCSKGPGSYTGIRVGLATAKGLARSTGKDFYAFSNADVLLSLAEDTESAAAVLDAGRDNYILCTRGEDGIEMSVLGSDVLLEKASRDGISTIIAAVADFERLKSTVADHGLKIKDASDNVNKALYELFREDPEAGRDQTPVYGREFKYRSD